MAAQGTRTYGCARFKIAFCGVDLWQHLYHVCSFRSSDEEAWGLQEGWRMAVAKRAKEELASREAALRTHLMHQRDQQLQVTPPIPHPTLYPLLSLLLYPFPCQSQPNGCGGIKAALPPPPPKILSSHCCHRHLIMLVHCSCSSLLACALSCLLMLVL